MMRKSHVRFPEKGVAIYWSFDQPPPVNTALGTADLQISLTTEFSERRQIFLWIASFAAFVIKVPMVPVHIWLPEAHVEAPTAGSVILAGIPSKLGTHGFLRFSIPMFPEATLCSTPFIYTPSVIAIIYTSLTTSRQIDLKKIIAYSSVAHMNLVTIGMFSRAVAVRSPIFSYGRTRQGQNMCAGRATHQPTSNGGENMACRKT
ncbi:NADH dehydrogenase I subunit 4 [Vigna unguiculata]|uniref:NADH-ubiquinone oxidoreductase chain 4 n=1 Tax=Vigna unguiculata TaxID=3917 RepID=A0A4D6KYS5_VIGUN|nr:NADH dehydrogenase I subunit 4 [Vigna unguiculata]